jgi:hypothetical protein
VNFLISGRLKGSRCVLSCQVSGQQALQPSKQEMEVVTGGGQHGVSRIAGMVCKMIATHAVLSLEMTDHWLNGGAAPQFALNLRCEPPLLALRVDPELVIGWRIVAAISGIGEQALDGVADLSSIAGMTVASV